MNLNFDTNIYFYNDYVDFLKNLLEELSSENPTYGQSSFAKDLGLSRPRISQILNRKEGLSAKRAESISKSLNLSDEKEKYFLHLVNSVTGKSHSSRLVSKEYIDKCQE